MADRMSLSVGEVMMVFAVVICLLAILAVIGMHLGIVPGCKATRVCT
ncbi:MAG: hypothetical protein ACRDZP_01440 [Acidimicrobiales bacterium]